MPGVRGTQAVTALRRRGCVPTPHPHLLGSGQSQAVVSGVRAPMEGVPMGSPTSSNPVPPTSQLAGSPLCPPRALLSHVAPAWQCLPDGGGQQNAGIVAEVVDQGLPEKQICQDITPEAMQHGAQPGRHGVALGQLDCSCGCMGCPPPSPRACFTPMPPGQPIRWSLPLQMSARCLAARPFQRKNQGSESLHTCPRLHREVRAGPEPVLGSQRWRWTVMAAHI